MYTLTQRPSQLASKTNHRGRVSTLRIKEFEQNNTIRFEPPEENANMSQQKPVFKSNKPPVRQLSSGSNPDLQRQHSSGSNPELQTPQHRDNVKFLTDRWYEVSRFIDQRAARYDGPNSYYQDLSSSPSVEHKTFNLDEWWHLNRKDLPTS